MLSPVNISSVNAIAGLLSLLLLALLTKRKGMLQKIITEQSMHIAIAIATAIAAYSICSTIALFIGEMFGMA